MSYYLDSLAYDPGSVMLGQSMLLSSMLFC